MADYDGFMPEDFPPNQNYAPLIPPKTTSLSASGWSVTIGTMGRVGDERPMGTMSSLIIEANGRLLEWVGLIDEITSFTLESYGDATESGSFSEELTSFETVAAGGPVPEGAFEQALESFEILASGEIGPYGGMLGKLPTFTLSGDDLAQFDGLSARLSYLLMVANGIVVEHDPTGSLVGDIPSFYVVSDGAVHPLGGGDELFQNIVLHLKAAGVRGATGVTTYSTEFNSIAHSGGAVYAASKSGVFRREGATDNGENVRTRIAKRGFDAGSPVVKTFIDAVLRVKSVGGYSLGVDAGGETHSVNVSDNINRVHGSKAILPRGVSGRELGFLFESLSPTELEELEFTLGTSSTRRERQTK